MGITCRPWGEMKGKFAKLERKLDAEKKAEKRAIAKNMKKINR